MNELTNFRNRGLFASTVVFLLILLAAGATAQQPNASIPADDLVHYLQRTIAWYRIVDGTANLEGISNEIVLNNGLHQAALRAVQTAFDFARANAALIAASGRQSEQAQAAGGRLEQAAQRAAARISNIQSRISALDASLVKARAKERPVLQARRRELEAELNLAEQVQQTVQGIMSAAGGAVSGGGLIGQINELERSVPEARNHQQRAGAAQTSPAAAVGSAATPAPDVRVANTPVFRAESSGLLSLLSELISLTKTESQLKSALATTDSLSDEMVKLRVPLTSGVRSAVEQSEQLASAAANETVEQIAADQLRIDALAAQFRKLSTALIPLGQQQIFIENARGNLEELLGAAQRQRNDVARNLFIRTAMIGAGVLILLAISAVWQRATFRYIHDLRRRRQLTIVRRAVIGMVTAVVVVLGVISDFGSVATYAGFLTAGIAVALQNVILAVVAYFFFIGRYGVKVGDLVTISGVTGNVIEIGLVRLYLMELAGAAPDMHPTGRIVVLSNSVLFQPAPLFKQISGTNYVWHKVTVTLTPDADIEKARHALTDAVESVLGAYQTEIERQHAAFERSMDIQVREPNPDYHFRYTDGGLEFTVQYPAEFKKAAAVDNKVIQALYEAIAKDGDLHLAPNGGPRVG